MADKYKLPLRPLRSFLSLRELEVMLPRLKNPIAFLLKSKTVHAVELPDTKEILVHPDTVYKAVGRYGAQVASKLFITPADGTQN